jgi:hypothetical protein
MVQLSSPLNDRFIFQKIERDAFNSVSKKVR